MYHVLNYENVWMEQSDKPSSLSPAGANTSEWFQFGYNAIGHLLDINDIYVVDKNNGIRMKGTIQSIYTIE